MIDFLISDGDLSLQTSFRAGVFAAENLL